MNTQIEAADQKRTKYRGGHVVWLIVFFVAWVLRSVLKIGDYEPEGLHAALLGVLILSVLVQGYYALLINLLERQIRRDPVLKEALNNELVCLNQLKAWRASFFAVIMFVILAAVVSLFVQYRDPMLILITTLLVGFGTYNTAVYLLDR